MDSSSTTPPKVVYESPSLFRAYDDGTIDRFAGNDIVPPSISDEIKSKDVVYSPKFNLSSRLYLPKYIHKKVPILLYFHGGGFCIYTSFEPAYHTYLTKLAEQANVLIVSVDYRRAPEYPLPAAFEDAWEALHWVASHSDGSGPEEWVNNHADLQRVYLAGDNAGATIAHNLGVRIGVEKFGGLNVIGIVVVHAFFGGKEAIEGETEDPKMRAMADGLWNIAYPNSIDGSDNPAMNPSMDPNLSKLGCKKVLVMIAEKDELLKRRCLFYCDKLKNSGWEGSVEIMETKDEEHNFHILINPTCDNAAILMKKFASFINSN